MPLGGGRAPAEGEEFQPIRSSQTDSRTVPDLVRGDKPGLSITSTEAELERVCEAAGALMHSLTRNHPFVDGSRRAGWNAAWTFIEANAIGRLSTGCDVDAAERFTLDVASGVTADLTLIAAGLQSISG